jgi:hypothetical protein
MEFKKKKYSGNSVIMKYEVTNISRIFYRGVIKTNFDFIHKDTNGSNYQQINKTCSSFKNHEFNF